MLVSSIGRRRRRRGVQRGATIRLYCRGQMIVKEKERVGEANPVLWCEEDATQTGNSKSVCGVDARCWVDGRGQVYRRGGSVVGNVQRANGCTGRKAE